MNSSAKLAAFALGLGVLFGAAAAVGAAVGPIDVGGSPEHDDHVAPSAVSVPVDHSGHDSGTSR